jgi:RNA polymerase sigma-70 factor (ECF subfamily)
VPPSPEATSPTLLARVQANQAGAWERLVDLYAPLVYHWCRRWSLGPEDAADVFQEVFRSVAEHIARFRHDQPGVTVRGWLRTITRNKVCDHFRRNVDQPRAAAGSDAQMLLLGQTGSGVNRGIRSRCISADTRVNWMQRSGPPDAFSRIN